MIFIFYIANYKLISYTLFMKFDGIILDIDGTIWDTTPIVAEAWNNAITANFPQVPLVNADILKGQFAKPMNVIADNLFSVLPENEKAQLLNLCCAAEQKALSENTKNITFSNVVETIAELSKTHKLFIVSNCQSGYIEVVIEKNHISQFITDSECFGNNGNQKDENISLIVKRNNLKNPVYVGDTAGDAEACKKADVPFIWASYGFGKVDEFFAKITDFSQLLEIVKN